MTESNLAVNNTSKHSESWILLAGFAYLGIPSFRMVFGGIHLHPILDDFIFRMGIVGGAFLISWAAEAAQLDVSASFAIAILALIAILPEYTVQAVLAWDAGQSYDVASGTEMLLLVPTMRPVRKTT